MKKAKDIYIEFITKDSENYKEVSGRKGIVALIKNRLTATPISDQRYIWSYIKTLRKCEYRLRLGGGGQVYC